MNGVAVAIAAADRWGNGRESEFLALFPEFDAWLRVGVEGGRSSAVDAGNALLSTIQTTASPTGRPAPQRFIGNWRVHGAALDISRTTGVVTANCEAPCVETDTLRLSPSPDGRRLNAVIAAITYTNSATGQTIPNPDPYPSDSAGVGDTSYFEFVAPHLLKEIFVKTSVTTGSGYGNPYWCGEGLDPSLSFDCGA